MKRIIILLTAVLCSFGVYAQESGVSVAPGEKARGIGLTPQMGWSSWNAFECNISESVIREMADKMVELGLVDAGYVYLNIDDCWHGERDKDGFIHPDPERFPNGMAALAEYVHSKGMKFGIYSDAGCMTCGKRPGSLGHEYQDALSYARWGIDYLKYDWCYNTNLNHKGAYTLMRDALAATGRPILFSMCEWGKNKPWEWAGDIGHSWRTTGDIGVSFHEDIVHADWRQLSVMHIVDINEKLRAYAGPGHWNDPDMLECGNGMTQAQDRAHFTLWAMMAAPLILGNDLRTMSKETLAIVTNRDIISIDQDPLGVQGLRYLQENGLEYWFKPLVNGKWAVAIHNRNSWESKCVLDWQRFSFRDGISKCSISFNTTVYQVKDIWGNCPSIASTTKKGGTFTIPADDIVCLILTPAGTR